MNPAIVGIVMDAILPSIQTMYRRVTTATSAKIAAVALLVKELDDTILPTAANRSAMYADCVNHAVLAGDAMGATKSAPRTRTSAAIATSANRAAIASTAVLAVRTSHPTAFAENVTDAMPTVIAAAKTAT